MVKIDRNKLIQITNLLPKEYQNVKFKIKYNAFSFLLSNPSYLPKIKKTSRAFFRPIQNDILILPFKFKITEPTIHDFEIIKLETVSCLFHELRHFYQYNYRLHEHEEEFCNYSKLCKEIGWENLKIEIDAQKFAKYSMEKYKKEIDKILNISINWSWK